MAYKILINVTQEKKCREEKLECQNRGGKVTGCNFYRVSGKVS